jgi:ring-1,2-phenylacetyl-CoA epoxidase subunit PaaD
MKTEASVWQILSEIPDPEIPVITIVELGVIRKIDVLSETAIRVQMTPTYSGCPAMKQMEDDVKKRLTQDGFTDIQLNITYNPPWTSDWLNEAAKQKLQNYGIAPPEESTSDKSFLTGKIKNITCPRCKSKNTNLISQFGSTACKALYQCKECLEPFDYFKCI